MKTYQRRIQELNSREFDLVDRLDAMYVGREADAQIAALQAECDAFYQAAGDAQVERDAAREERDALKAECDALRAAFSDYLTAQDALDNHELMGPNAEDYFTLMRRRNAERRHLAAAIDNERSKA